MLLRTEAPQAPAHPSAHLPDHASDPIAHTLAHDWHEQIVTFLRDDVPHLLVILLIAFVLWRLVVFSVNRMHRIADRQTANTQRAAQLRTMAGILRATAYSIIGFIVLLQVLSVVGVKVAPLLASAGVVGVGIGLGAQSIFKDVLNGIFILIEDQYNVGDIVRIASLSGTVELLTLRTTRLRDADGTLNIIPNSQIATVQNLSRDFSVANLPVSVDASADPDRVIATLRSIANDIRADPTMKDIVLADPTIPGVDRIDGRSVTYPVIIRVRATQKDIVLRELRRRIIQTFERTGIPLGSASDLLILQHAKAPTAPPAPPIV